MVFGVSRLTTGLVIHSQHAVWGVIVLPWQILDLEPEPEALLHEPVQPRVGDVSQASVAQDGDEGMVVHCDQQVWTAQG